MSTQEVITADLEFPWNYLLSEDLRLPYYKAVFCFELQEEQHMQNNSFWEAGMT